MGQLPILAATLVFLAAGMIVFFIFYLRLLARQKSSLRLMQSRHAKALLNANVEDQEAQIKRIARDLHDNVGGLLSTTKMHLQEILEKKKHMLTEELKIVLTSSKDLVDESVDSVRKISRELLPGTLEKSGLRAAIKELCRHVSVSESFKAHFECSEEMETIDKEHGLHLYRIIQELLNNTIKHAQASEVRVKLEQIGRRLKFNYQDNGIGFSKKVLIAGPDQGLGMRNIASRVQYLQGILYFETGINRGLKAEILLNYDTLKALKEEEEAEKAQKKENKTKAVT